MSGYHPAGVSWLMAPFWHLGPTVLRDLLRGLDVGDPLHEAQAAGDAGEPERLVELRDGLSKRVDDDEPSVDRLGGGDDKSEGDEVPGPAGAASTLLP